jgi:imidazoleglycerol-phosphate dehydratase
MNRKVKLKRKTRETIVEIVLNIDGKGLNQIDTGIGLLDHFLEQIAVHGSFDLSIKAQGDLHVDCHHLIEDIGIVLGKAFKRALGDKIGIVRNASSYFPLDEALSLVVIDISGRAYFESDICWVKKTMGNKKEFRIPVSLIEHFLYSFVINAKLTAHVKVLSGKNDHHIAESLFKALGKALDKASRIDMKKQNSIPSSKGIIE